MSSTITEVGLELNTTACGEMPAVAERCTAISLEELLNPVPEMLRFFARHEIVCALGVKVGPALRGGTI
jgi:hypothetical protein